MRSTSRCADCWTCVTLLAPPDCASSGLDRARVVCLRQVLWFSFFGHNHSSDLSVSIRTYTSKQIHIKLPCAIRKLSGSTGSRVHSVSISSWWFHSQRVFFLCEVLFHLFLFGAVQFHNRVSIIVYLQDLIYTRYPVIYYCSTTYCIPGMHF